MEPYAVSMRDAIAYTSLSKSTLNRLVQQKRLEKLYVDGKPLFRLADLRALIEGKGKAT
jgi:hypothetical protein